MQELTISQVSKTYSNGVKALDQISLKIPNGMFGLLGPNGAGKSSLMRTLATLQEIDEGHIYLNELNVLEQKNEVRKVLGYLPQEFGLYPRISALALLNHLAILKGIGDKRKRLEIVNILLEKTNLFPYRNKQLATYSGGMKQRFGVAQALLNNPKLLIVDEPTAGLDPVERNRFFRLLCELSEESTVIFSTHIVEDVKAICPNMAIMNKGKVLLAGSPWALVETMRGKVYQKSILTHQFEQYNRKYDILADKLFLGKPVIQIYSKVPPEDGFEPIPATLDHVYFNHIKAD